VVGEPELGVAVTVTTALVVSPVKSNVGVSSAVWLSVLEVPKSDEEFRSGALGVPIETVTALVDLADKLPVASTAYR
jgi:hypothetical protein